MNPEPDYLAGLGDGVPEPKVPDGVSSWVPVALTEATAAHADAVPPSLMAGTDGSALIYPGRRHFIYGEPETLKSWVALVVAVEALARGERVVWIDADAMGARDLAERARALGASADDLARIAYITPDGPTGDDGDRAILALAAGGPAVVVVDAYGPTSSALGLAQNSADDVDRLYQVVVGPFHRAGATTLVLDHVTKDKETRGRWAIGSQRKLAVADVGLMVALDGAGRLSRTTPGSVRVTVTKDRPGHLDRSASRRVTFTPDGAGGVGWLLRVQGGAGEGAGGFRPTHLMERVSRHLEAAGRPLSRNEATDVKGNTDAVRTALAALVSEGFVSVERAGQAHLHRVVRGYREADDALSDGAPVTLTEPTEPKPSPTEPIGPVNLTEPTEPPGIRSTRARGPVHEGGGTVNRAHPAGGGA